MNFEELDDLTLYQGFSLDKISQIVELSTSNSIIEQQKYTNYSTLDTTIESESNTCRLPSNPFFDYKKAYLTDYKKKIWHV